MSSSIGISVIICCFNSEDRIKQTIAHLATQEFSQSINWEIIIVDNASTDDTYSVALEECEKYEALNSKVQIINELKVGLSFARAAGVKKARFSLLCFCDDDNWLFPNYLQLAFNIMNHDTKIGAIGGKGFAKTSDGTLPGWFKDFESWYAVGAQNSCFADSLEKCNLWGAGIVTRRDLYLRAFYNFPSIAIGRKGDNLSSGEDTEFCLRAILMGYKLFYKSNLKYYHFIANNRLQKNYRDNLKLGFKEANHHIVKYFILIKVVNASLLSKFGYILKSTLGYFSTFFGRKSYSFENVKTAVYYAFKINLGVDEITKKIYQFHEENLRTCESL